MVTTTVSASGRRAAPSAVSHSAANGGASICDANATQDGIPAVLDQLARFYEEVNDAMARCSGVLQCIIAAGRKADQEDVEGALWAVYNDVDRVRNLLIQRAALFDYEPIDQGGAHG